MLPQISLSLGSTQIHIHMYDLFIIISMASGLVMAGIELKNMNVRKKNIYLICLLIPISFLIGARVLNYVINYKKYTESGIPLFIMKSGYFSLYGGIGASFAALIFVSKKIKLGYLQLFDRLTVPFLLSFSLMKIGCLLNGCCYGKITKSVLSVPLPLKQQYDMEASALISTIFGRPEIRVYPAQVMELLAALLIITLVTSGKYFLKNTSLNKKGARFAVSAALLSLFRLIILHFRSTSYSLIVLNIFYPLLYMAIIIVSLAFLCSRSGFFNLNFFSHSYKDDSADAHKDRVIEVWHDIKRRNTSK